MARNEQNSGQSRPTAPRFRRVRVLLRALASLLLGLGTLLVLFAMFQLWGTALTQHNSQSQLRKQFAEIQSTTTTTVETSTTTTTTTTTTTQVAPPAPRLVPSPLTLGDPVARLEIPKIHVDQIVVQGTDDAQLRMGPGHYPSTPVPGAPGNIAIAGHRTTYGAPFFHLDQLKVGDQIYLITPYGRYTYAVVRDFVVAPNDVSVVKPSKTISLTLTTCNPRYSAAQRLIVQAVVTTNPTISPRAVEITNTQAEGLARSTVSESSLPATVAWGFAFVFVLAVVYFARRRYGHAVIVALFGIPAIFIVMFVFFQELSNLLPPSF